MDLEAGLEKFKALVNRTLNRRRITQGVVERARWVKLKQELAAEGLVVPYFCSLEDDVLEDAAA